MEKNKQANLNRRKNAILVLVLAMMLGCLMPQRVQAREYSEAATLYVCDKTIIYDGELQEAVVSDGNGGTAVYDYDNNTLTLTNFHGKETENRTLIQANYMEDDFTIILNGNNSLETTYHATISVNNGSLCITGGGSLGLNEGIIGTMNNMKVENCQLNIHATSYGISSNRVEVEIDDAVVNIQITQDGVLHQLAGAINAKKLTVNSSNITTSVPEAGTETNVGVYAPRAIFVSEEGGIELSSDMSVTNEKGVLLQKRVYYGGSSVGNKYVYSTESGTEIITDESKLATCVNITSTVKTKKIEDQKKIDDVINLIDGIGTVTEGSGDRIEAARKAYEALSEELKSRITNYGLLQGTESTYRKIKEESKVKEAINLIAGIGTVTEESKDRIEAARKAYNELSNELKQKVTNYKTLEAAEITYQKIEKSKAKKITIRSVVSKKKNRVVVKWKREKTVDGYQIAYSRKKNFKNQKTKLVNKNKTVKYTLKKLKSKKTYYIKVRSYTKVNGKRVYGKWSKVKKVRVK